LEESIRRLLAQSPTTGEELFAAPDEQRRFVDGVGLSGQVPDVAIGRDDLTGEMECPSVTGEHAVPERDTAVT
jgi:hypothetical protein